MSKAEGGATVGTVGIVGTVGDQVVSAMAEASRGGAAGRRGRLVGVGWAQGMAMVLCVALGLAMVVNNQMGGEGMWFWYGTIFDRGVKPYSQMHLALQPLFLELTGWWMRLVGQRLVLTQIPSVVEIGLMCVGMLLVLRESRWAEWTKGLILLGAFSLTVFGHSYRFDDYHVLAENLILFSLVGMLWMERAGREQGTADGRRMALAAGLGVLAGLTVTTRLTDGAALLATMLLCVPVLLERRRLAGVGLLVLTAGVTVVVVVRLTGDGLGVWLASSIFRAAGSKGGTGSIAMAPLLTLRNTPGWLLLAGKRASIGLAVLLAIGPLVHVFWRRGREWVFALQMGAALLLFVVVTRFQRELLLEGIMVPALVLWLTPWLYVVGPLVLARAWWARATGRRVDWREVLFLLPLAEWSSYAAGAAGEPLTNYYAPLAMALLLVAVVDPFGGWPRWVNASYLTVMALLAASTFPAKAKLPYQWQNYDEAPMFEGRVWYRHPVYGEMYIGRDLLSFSEAVCRDIGSRPGVNQPALLTLPYPYPNFFCDTPPWHDYVQTFFDTSTRATIERLEGELRTDPPEWIVYQRQLNIMTGAEKLYNHGQPLAQRDLDRMIFDKVARGEWTLVDRSDYLGRVDRGGGWFIVKTSR